MLCKTVDNCQIRLGLLRASFRLIISQPITLVLLGIRASIAKTRPAEVFSRVFEVANVFPVVFSSVFRILSRLG